MNKFQVAYYIVLVLFLVTLLSVFGVSCDIGPGGFAVALDLFWLPLLVNGYLVYVLKDWRKCSVA